MAGDTAGVTRPHTGLPYLDAGRDDGAVLAFAHRGGAHHPDIAGLENTLAAFDHAVKLGYQYLETDVHTTSDGVLLSFHDDVLDRVTSRVGPVAGTAYVDLAYEAFTPDYVEKLSTFSDARLRWFRRLVSRRVATSYGPVGVGLSRFAPRSLA